MWSGVAVFFSSRRRHTRLQGDWSSDVCSSDLVGFLFYDLRNNAPLTDTAVVFQGICNAPDEIKESTFRLTATNRMNLQRLLLPQVRIQRRCPWEFPATQDQRAEAVNGGASGKYSRY